MNYDRTKKLVYKNLRIAYGYFDFNHLNGCENLPKILINSVPKCGTNLVQEIVQRYPGVRGTFNRTIHGEPNKETFSFIEKMKKGRCSTAHLFHTSELESVLEVNEVKVIHVVRDFRDSLISQVNFLGSLGSSHRHGKLFDSVTEFDEKLSICLEGVPDTMKGWKEILPRFQGWSESNALIVRYEDLYKELYLNLPGTEFVELKRIAEFLNIEIYDEKLLVREATNTNSLTYNSPGIEKWRSVMSEEQIITVNNALKEHLDRYNYSV